MVETLKKLWVPLRALGLACFAGPGCIDTSGNKTYPRADSGGDAPASSGWPATTRHDAPAPNAHADAPPTTDAVADAPATDAPADVPTVDSSPIVDVAVDRVPTDTATDAITTDVRLDGTGQ